MISPTLTDAVNEQIKHELYSSNIYLSMAAYFDSGNLPGFAHWMKKQAEEERGHALRLYEYLVDRGGKPVVAALAAPPADFKGAIDAFSRTLEHEQKVTGMIHKLYELALKESDYPTQMALQWFINEQVEEEKNATEILERLKSAGESPVTLMMLDGHLGKRG